MFEPNNSEQNNIAQDTITQNTVNSENTATLRSKNAGWIFSHIGTGIGAGLLYLPIEAGGGGFWPLLIIAIISCPVVLLTHRGFTRFCLSSKKSETNIIQTFKEHFGRNTRCWLMAICFFSIFPVLLLYTIGITNVTESFIIHQIGWAAPSRTLLVGILVVGMITLFCGSERRLLALISGLVFPLTIILLFLGLYLIPQWRMDFILQPIAPYQGIKAALITLPLIVFSFYHAPVCAPFAHSYRKHFSNTHECIKHTDKIHFKSSLVLLGITYFFVFSCVMTLTPDQLHLAREANLPILSILANQPGNAFFSTMAPIIAFIAILTSFFGFFIGALEVMNGLLIPFIKKLSSDDSCSAHHAQRLSLVIIAIACWIAGVGNWSVLTLMEAVVAPMMAIILFFLPSIALYRVNLLQRYRRPLIDACILLIGICVLLGFFLSQLL